MKERGGDVGGGGGFPEMMHGERRSLDSRDQDMRSLAMRGSDRYSPDAWGASADKNGRAQYSSGGSPGYGMRGGASDGERSRGWHGSAPPQDGWSKSSGGSLMGEYQGEEHVRGPAQNAPMMHGAAYASPSGNGGAGLLSLPMDAGEYAKPPPRTPQASQMGLEGQYASSQSMMHFEERDYSLSGYDADSRAAQYGGGGSGHQQRSTGGWQQGGGDGGRGRGMGQGWRRGKPF